MILKKRVLWSTIKDLMTTSLPIERKKRGPSLVYLNTSTAPIGEVIIQEILVGTPVIKSKLQKKKMTTVMMLLVSSMEQFGIVQNKHKLLVFAAQKMNTKVITRSQMTKNEYQSFKSNNCIPNFEILTKYN